MDKTDRSTGPLAAAMFTALLLRGALDKKTWHLAQRHVNSIRKNVAEALRAGQIGDKEHDEVIARMDEVQKKIDQEAQSVQKECLS